MRIAIDIMGGDKGPREIISGAFWAAHELDAGIVLVGEKEVIEAELRHQPAGLRKNVDIEPASDWIRMGEPAAVTTRRKKGASINVAVNLVRQGKVDAIVSAGNTGATVCAASLRLGLLEGIERPGIAIIFPTLVGPCVLMDVGANIDAKPAHLVQYAFMGDIYCRYILGKKNPRIGVLSVGEEEGKGSTSSREVYNLLNKTNLNFIGNVEGDHLCYGESDVIVTNGFVGNVVLKVAEGLVETLGELLRRKLRSSVRSKIGALFSLPAFRSLQKELSHAEFGGAPLLGVNGICIIAHGSSSKLAIKNAIKVAVEFVEHQVNKHIVEAVKEFL